MRYSPRTLLIFVVAIIMGLCEGAIICGMLYRASNPKSPLLIAALLSQAMILGGASAWVFNAMDKWARAK